MFSCLRRSQKHFQGGGTKFRHIFKRSFYLQIVLKHIENEKDCEEVRGHAPPKKIKNSHSVVAILVGFEQFLGKFCLSFLPLILSVSPILMHFVHTFSLCVLRA